MSAIGEVSDGYPIVSTLHRGREVHGLIVLFARALPAMVADIYERVSSEDLQGAAALAHRLKGSAGGYGFGPIRDAADLLEQRARAADQAGSLRMAAELTTLPGRIRIESHRSEEDPL